MRRPQRLFCKIIWSLIVDDFKRVPKTKTLGPTPVRPVAQPPRPIAEPPAAPRPIEQMALPSDLQIDSPKPRKSRKKRGWLIALLSFFLLAVMAVAGGWWWYNSQLEAVNADDTTKKMIVIESGSTPNAIATQLEDEGLIRSATVFFWYTRIEGVQNALQAGSYRLSPSESTAQIVEHLTNGSVDTFTITFIPGTTVRQQKQVLVNAGYEQQEVDAAFAKTYDSPLFAGKPATADLEGYVYPETYTFGADTSVEAILEYTFAEFYKVIEQNNLVEAYKAKNLTLFQGIVMASIIQKEAVGGDERQIAQVFLSRYAIGMKLGSDPTYQYITDKLGVPRDLNYDSPYNTRRYEGIPPGPIANPNVTMLKAVATPATGDYLYFFSGDDDVTYYSNTLEEHERKVAQLCKVKCSFL